MKQEDIDIMMNKIDKKCKLPKYWNKFVEDNSKTHHLIIKNNKTKELYCTNCNKKYIDKTIRVRDYIECPHCKEKSEVYGINYYRKSFENSVILVQRINKQIVIRVFEIYSYFLENSKEIQRSYIEYARILPGIGKFLGNNVYLGMFGDLKVYHGYKKLNWHKYNGYKYFTDFPIYPYSKTRLLKGTHMEYAPIKEFMNRFSYCRYNFLDALQLAAYESFEILWNMKLYNLCFYSKALNKNGSFYKRFGVPKNFLKFMQDNNINYNELLLLRLFKKADRQLLDKFRYTCISHLKFLINEGILEAFLKSGNDMNTHTIQILKNLKEYIPLKKLNNYPKGLQYLSIYKDYLDMAKKLALNYKSKKDLFPRNLIARHDKLQTKIKVQEDITTQFKAYSRFLELSKYIYEDDKYIIFPAPSIADMKDEGNQQCNCVGYMYLNPYIDGKTEIYFMRDLKDVTKSLVTLEFNFNNVVQKEQSNHEQTTVEQNDFIDKWILYRDFIDKKLKYAKKNTNKIIHYELKELVS